MKLKEFNKDKLINIINNKWIIAILLIPFIKPASEITKDFDIIFDISKIFCTIIFISLYILFKKKPSLVIIIITLLESSFILSTIINEGRIVWSITQAISIISLALFLEFELKANRKNTLSGFAIATGVMVSITIATMFIYYPNGMYTVEFEHNIPGLWHIPEKSNYFWGFDNSSVFLFIPTLLIFILLYMEEKNKKIKYICLILMVASFVAFLYVRAITATIACFAMLILYLIVIFNKTKIIKIFNYQTCIVIAILVFASLIGINKNISVLQKIAENTDKVVSLNYRFLIWENTLNEFNEHKIIGNGIEETMVAAQKLGIDHPHNIFLDILYKGRFSGTYMLYCYDFASRV